MTISISSYHSQIRHLDQEMNTHQLTSQILNKSLFTLKNQLHQTAADLTKEKLYAAQNALLNYAQSFGAYQKTMAEEIDHFKRLKREFSVLNGSSFESKLKIHPDMKEKPIGKIQAICMRLFCSLSLTSLRYKNYQKNLQILQKQRLELIQQTNTEYEALRAKIASLSKA